MPAQVYAVAMRRLVLLLLCCFTVPALRAASPQPSAWKAKLVESMPLLGHRNWILIVDSAYPLQSSPGVETLETNASQLDVVQAVLDTINHSIHVRPDIFMDAELPFLSDTDAPGVSAYRTQIAGLLDPYKIQSLPHEKIIAHIDEAGKTFHILVLKTNMTIPYTSVFIQLNCRYWSDDAEARLRAKMKGAPGK
jgi:RbsD / FucU transport protein family